MNKRERESLDRYITGDYGERQFREYYGDEPDICEPEPELKWHTKRERTEKMFAGAVALGLWLLLVTLVILELGR